MQGSKIHFSSFVQTFLVYFDFSCMNSFNTNAAVPPIINNNLNKCCSFGFNQSLSKQKDINSFQCGLSGPRAQFRFFYLSSVWGIVSLVEMSLGIKTWHSPLWCIYSSMSSFHSHDVGHWPILLTCIRK